MSAKLPKLAFSRLEVAPPPSSIQFYDGCFPQLSPGAYTITVSHQVQKQNSESPAASYTLSQQVMVQAPEFLIDPATVQSVYPANRASDTYDQDLPFAVIADPCLPWERKLAPGSTCPWIALVLFAEGEVYLQGPSNSPVATSTVGALLTPDPSANTQKPLLPANSVSPEVCQSQCQTVTIPGATFNAVMPLNTELPYLAHCRSVNAPDEDQVLVSVLLANRLPVASGESTRYYAHIVSLEGFAAYLGPGATPIPTKPNSNDLMDVQLCSLYNWTFVSQAKPLLSFEQLVTNLIASEAATQGTLQLPVPQTNLLPPAAASRLQQGYAALQFISGSGDETLAWYRGPFTPVVPQPLPSVGNPAVPASQANSADELMIYLAQQGLFDLSYAAAWNIGRNLALADAQFAQLINGYADAAKTAAATIAQRLAMPHLAGVANPRALLARDATRKRFAQLVGAGLTRQWTGALAAARRGDRPDLLAQPRRLRRRLVPQDLGHARQVLANSDAVSAIADQVAGPTDSVAAWLANLSLLYPVPFSHLVPDARMLPVESIRFFYVDQGWIDALTAGAMSIAFRTAADAAVITALHSSLLAVTTRKRRERLVRTRRTAIAGDDGGNATMSGILIRSQLVAGWPQLVIAATAGGVPVNIVRDDRPSPSVRLCLFEGIPDTVNLSEPYQGLRFGVPSNGIVPRYVSGGSNMGGQIPNASPVPTNGYQGFLTTYCRGNTGGVVQIAALASALQKATGVVLGAGNLAIQLVRAPEWQQFPSS